MTDVEWGDLGGIYPGNREPAESKDDLYLVKKVDMDASSDEPVTDLVEIHHHDTCIQQTLVASLLS